MARREARHLRFRRRNLSRVSLLEEIRQQPAVIERLVAAQVPRLDELARRLRRRPVDGLVIAGRGSSDHAAVYAQYVFGIRLGLPVALAAPSIGSLYGREVRFERMLVVGISQSGASPDVVGVLEAARRQGAPTLAITNTPESALGAVADDVIDLAAGPERALAATKTYTAELAAIACLATALDGPDGARRELAALPAAIDGALAAEAPAETAAVAMAATDRCVVLGRGFEYATAREWALKLKELAYVLADPYSAADFEHGPLALIEAGFPVLAVVRSGPAAPGMAALLERLRGELGATVLVVSDDAAMRALGAQALASPPDVPEWLGPISDIVPCQLFARALTIARGLDPEAPRHLRKVTRTT
jgi:glucosamine--fructose-6-phosphate aminotransferase (isomerizing)